MRIARRNIGSGWIRPMSPDSTRCSEHLLKYFRVVAVQYDKCKYCGKRNCKPNLVGHPSDNRRVNYSSPDPKCDGRKSYREKPNFFCIGIFGSQDIRETITQHVANVDCAEYDERTAPNGIAPTEGCQQYKDGGASHESRPAVNYIANRF